MATIAIKNLVVTNRIKARADAAKCLRDKLAYLKLHPELVVGDMVEKAEAALKSLKEKALRDDGLKIE